MKSEQQRIAQWMLATGNENMIQLREDKQIHKVLGLDDMHDKDKRLQSLVHHSSMGGHMEFHPDRQGKKMEYLADNRDQKIVV